MRVNERPVKVGTHPIHGNRTILDGRYRGYNMVSNPGADGKAWFEGGRGDDDRVYLLVGDTAKPETTRPTAAPPAYHAPVDYSALLPEIPELPAAPKAPEPILMPVPDDAAIRAEMEKKRARAAAGGRKSTILSQNNMLN